MYHLTVLWLIIVAGTATVSYLAGWRRGRRFEREIWDHDATSGSGDGYRRPPPDGMIARRGGRGR